jgi:hypothetical protein
MVYFAFLSLVMWTGTFARGSLQGKYDSLLQRSHVFFLSARLESRTLVWGC